MNFVPFVETAIASFLSWIIVLAFLSKLMSLPRLSFVISHYLLNILIFGIVFSALYKFTKPLSPFTTMATAMVTLFAVEFIFWKFIYTGKIWFLNFFDWILPAFLVASTIYLVGLYFKGS